MEMGQWPAEKPDDEIPITEEKRTMKSYKTETKELRNRVIFWVGDYSINNYLRRENKKDLEENTFKLTLLANNNS